MKNDPELLQSHFLAERQGFEPWVPFWSTHDFQSCLFSHSSISPDGTKIYKMFRLVLCQVGIFYSLAEGRGGADGDFVFVAGEHLVNRIFVLDL